MKRLFLLLTLLIAGITANAQFSPSNNLNYVKLLKDPPVATKNDSVVMFDGTDKFLKMMPVSELVDNTTIYLELAKKQFLSTGLIKNGIISANGDPTKFNVTTGIGVVSNFDTPENPISRLVTFPAFTGVTPTYLLTGTITYVAIEEIGTSGVGQLFMQATPFTPEQRRSLIVLGAVIHSNLTNINVINNISAPTNASTNQLHDFIEAVGALNLTGNKYTANGANLQLNKSAGLIFKLGSNFANDWKNPHELAQTAGTSLTFRYRTQNGTEGSDRINLDPALYDLNNVLTAVPNNKFTIQTVTMFQSGVTRIQYGQTVYDDLATAKNAVFTRNFVLEPNSKENGIIRAYIIMRNTTTSLQMVADADILEAQKFGGVASGGVALTLASIVDALGFTPENVANKATDFTTVNNTLYPSVQATNDRFINKTSDPQTKTGSIILGENLTKSSDNWIAFGTSITSGGKYTNPMAKQLSLVLNNFGISGSNTASLVGNFINIPTLNSGNIDSYRLLTIEHGINDALGFNTISNFKENITNFILDAKAKGWTNNKILVINSNYCSRADLDTELEPYAIAAIEVAKEQGIQYVDIYNYTKNNGGASLLIDGVHLSEEGGRVYARGVISLMYGGLEVSNGLNVINGVRADNIYLSSDSEINGLSIGKGNGNISTNTILGNESLSLNTTGYDNTAVGYQSLKSNTTGRGNASLGYQTLYSNTTGVFNTASGYQVLYANTAGSSNTANGYSALGSNTIGSSNTSSGMLALATNTTGNENAATGMFSLLSNTTGSGNMANGYGSLSANTTGGSNSASGHQSLGSNTTGSDNTAVGRLSGYWYNINSSLTNPTNSIFLGSKSRALEDNGSNEIVIGYDVAGLGSNTTSIGNSSTTTTKIYGNIISPTFTGTPTAPTATLGTNTTQIATTAFVLANASGGSGDMLLATPQTVTGEKTFLDTKLSFRNVANTFSSYFTNTNTASRTYTLPNKNGTVALLDDAGWTASGGDLSNNNAGNVAIGMTPSTYKFRSSEDIAVGNQVLNADRSVFFESNSNSIGSELGGLKWYNRNSDGFIKAKISAVSDVTLTKGALAFYTGAVGANATEKMRIFANGDVAIGSMVGGAKLFVQGDNASATTFQVMGTSGSGTTFVLNNNNASFNNSLFYGFTTRSASTAFKMIDLRANSVPVFNVDGVGNIFSNGTLTATNLPIQLKDFYADVNNVSTTETDLLTYTTVANRLNATGEKLISNFAGTFNDVTASSQLKIYFAGQNIGDTGALTMSVTGAWVTTVSIIRTGATTGRAVVNISTPGASTASYTKYTSLTGLTFTGTNIVKITATASGATGGSDDITATYGNVIWQPAAL